MRRHIRLGGRSSGDAPTNLDAKLEVWDSPNSAGVAVYAVRCAKLALDRGISGASAYFMNFPPQQYMARQIGNIHCSDVADCFDFSNGRDLGRQLFLELDRLLGSQIPVMSGPHRGMLSRIRQSCQANARGSGGIRIHTRFRWCRPPTVRAFS